MRCSHASKVGDRLESFEDGGLAICCETIGPLSPFLDLSVGFVNDAFCDSLILSRLLLLHRSCPRTAIGRSSAFSQVCPSFFDHLQTQTNIFAYDLSCQESSIRDLTCRMYFSKHSTISSNICPQMPRVKRSPALMAPPAAPTSAK